jgi:hypothetical protein
MAWGVVGRQNKDWVPKVDPESEGMGFDIIQPVLQYPGDSGLYWSVKSWYVTIDSGAIASTERKIASGDFVFGATTLGHTGGCVCRRKH